MNQPRTSKTVTSIGIIAAAVILAFAPIPGLKQSLVIVSGTELKKPLTELKDRFEQKHPNLALELQFQGSQDIANNVIEQNQDFQPQILITANESILQELNNRYLAQHQRQAFIKQPTAIAKTMLVGIAWQDRGQALFPEEQFSWDRIEQAMKQDNWSKIAAQADWGNFDFVLTDPTRSNSSQLALALWLKAKNIDPTSSAAASLINLIKQSVYQPSRSTDILLQEFISRGANEGDVAVVYESIALYRWSQATTSQGQPYQVYYPEPTVETLVSAVVVNDNTSRNVSKAADKFIAYLTKLEQQQVFVKYGFRPIISGLDLNSVDNSPWSQNIPGVTPQRAIKTIKPPPGTEILQIQRLWTQSSP